ncbi:MAG: NHLP family bacteriocin export ABC transporter peptidase/permease/ATPase, partial [Oscillospiraceae bacterium]|nr:NHLP family bacteriocin export ABC transporter peptidase/permease/ATPase [Oscillospiraceae bacterium]
MKQPITKGCARVPVVMQMEALECGAASLAMVLAYYGKWLPLEKVRADCGVSRDGSKAKNIAVAARHHGLNAQGYRYEPDELKRSGRFPCVIHWNFNHFVVLAGFAGGKAVINDPAKGLVRVPMKQFDESFTGICIMFEPTEQFVPGGKPASVFGFAKKRLKGTAAAFVFIVLTSIIAAVAGIISPAFSRVFMDVLLPGGNDNWLMPFVLIMGGVALAQVAVECVKASYMLKVQGKLAVSAGAAFLWHVLRMPMEFFSQRMAGDIAMRQQSNENIAMSLISRLAPVFLNFGMLIFYLIVMLRFSVTLTLVGLISVVLNIGVSAIISKKRVNLTRVQMRDSGKLAGATVAGIDMIETLKASGSESGFFEKWSGYQRSEERRVGKEC